MTSQERLEISARLEEAVERITGSPNNAEEHYERYLMSASQILDSEVYLYQEDELYLYLRNYLEHKQLELGVTP